MDLEFVPLTDEPLGAVVRGWDPGVEPDRTVVEAVRAGLAEHLVLVFRGHRQPTDDELVRFASAFGELLRGSEWLRDSGDRPEILPVTNARDDQDIPLGTGGAARLEWHADYSYAPRTARESFLDAVELPPAGPCTAFASAYRAFETLPADLQQQLRGLRAVHSVAQYVEGGVDADAHDLNLGFEAKRRRDEAAGIERPAIPEAEHPVVRRHPDTGREFVYVSKGLTRAVVGLSRAESGALLKQLHLHATQAEHVYAHRWQVGDLVVFDALAGLHRRDSWDPSQRRVMRQLSTVC